MSKSPTSKGGSFKPLTDIKAGTIVSANKREKQVSSKFTIYCNAVAILDALLPPPPGKLSKMSVESLPLEGRSGLYRETATIWSQDVPQPRRYEDAVVACIHVRAAINKLMNKHNSFAIHLAELSPQNEVLSIRLTPQPDGEEKQLDRIEYIFDHCPQDYAERYLAVLGQYRDELMNELSRSMRIKPELRVGAHPAGRLH